MRSKMQLSGVMYLHDACFRTARIALFMPVCRALQQIAASIQQQSKQAGHAKAWRRLSQQFNEDSCAQVRRSSLIK